MATLSRSRPLSAQAQNHTHSLIDSHIPSPFPTHFLQQEREQHHREATAPAVLGHTDDEEFDVDPFVDQNEEQQESVINVSVELAESEIAQDSQEQDGEGLSPAETELVPTLSYVQQSCLMALNNLLAGLFVSTPHWQPILPPRRHSMPSRPENASTNEPSSALHTLLENLRKSDTRQMSEASSSSADDTVLLGELQRRVEAMSHELLPLDSQLARALISLLAHVNKLATIDSKLFNARAANVTSLETLTSRSHVDIYDQLSRQLLDLQHQRLDRTFDGPAQDTSPQRKVEIALLWSRIDQELETVSTLCRQRNEPPPSPYPDVLPPEYEAYGRGDDEALLPPEYEYASYAQSEKEKAPTYSHHQTQSSDAANEKMRMDLDAVAMAIDRLYLVAPQLHNQRVELRKSKVDELERARLAGPSSARNAERLSKGKEKENDVRELERIIDLVGKASSRRMDDQSVELNPDMKTRIERSKQRDKAKREAFVEHLLSHSNSRRIDSQDATFQADQVKSDDALLTLPEFIRERVPEELQQELERDPDALLTLSEIVKEPPPAPVKTPKSAPSVESLKTNKKHFKSLTKRSRSLSAPPLAWLIPSLSRTSSSLRLSQTASDNSTPARRMIVRYVAEHHESLNHVLMFVGVDEGLTAGCDLEAEVIPSVSDPSLGDKLVLKSGPSLSAPLSLPLVVPAGKVSVQVQGAHYELKIRLGEAGSGSAPVFASSRPSSSSISRHNSSLNWRGAYEHGHDQMHSQLLDATQVSEMDPTSFICASCSSALVQSQPQPQPQSQPHGFFLTRNHAHNQHPVTDKLTYLDLPSEHWEELLEAWMCHTDQKLSERVARHGRGFWPKAGQVFVGGSYFLFHESAVVSSNLSVVETNKSDEWRRVQCICGAVVGRCRSHSGEGDSEDSGSSIYRIPKYALRPVSLTSEPVRVPLSAFILEDMMEFVRAHATYRFVILDEEEERPRLLIWLFKPHLRLSYATTAQFALPRTGSVHAAKVLFKILQTGSSEGTNGVPPSAGGSSTPTHTPTFTPSLSHTSTPPPIRTPPSSPHSHSGFNLESILSKYPGFPQAERLLYPRDVCQRLTALLKESNTAYPFGVRVMTGLLTGWLQRS
ncbi:hypothetical protein ACEPAH_1628 [Sanghuangporus vaninii]